MLESIGLFLNRIIVCVARVDLRWDARAAQTLTIIQLGNEPLDSADERRCCNCPLQVEVQCVAQINKTLMAKHTPKKKQINNNNNQIESNQI